MKVKLNIPTKITFNTKVKTGLLILLFISFAIVLTIKFPILRYVKYLIFPALLVTNIVQERPAIRLNRVDKNYFYYTLLWILASLLSVFIGSVLNGPGEISLSRFVKEFYFINTALLSVVLLFNISNQQSIQKGFRFFIIVAFLYYFVIKFSSVLSLLSYRSSIFYFVTPPTENHYTTIFGAAFIYFLVKKDKKMMVLSLLLTIIGAKRIVFLAVIATTGLYFFLKPFSKIILNSKAVVIAMAIFMNFAVAIALVALTYGFFDDIIFDLTGIPPNWLFSGRVAMYKDVFDYMGSVPLLPKGLGYIGTILVDKQIHFNDFFIHMHSDVLKYMIEFGLLIFTLIFILLYRTALKNFDAFILVIYYNILMITDNPSILYEFYIFFHIIFVLLLRQTNPTRDITK